MASILNDYRKLTSAEVYYNLLQTVVSGVSLNYNPERNIFDVISPYNARWDGVTSILNKLPLMIRSSVHDEHGYVLHDACYYLLQKAFYPKSLPVRRLLGVCKSLPFQHLALSWGHDYGRIFSLEYHNPWIEQDISRRVLPPRWRKPANPRNIPELEELLQQSKLDSSKIPEVDRKKITFTDCAPTSNFFTRLPLEILGQVVIYLPTEWVKNLSRASKQLALVIPSGLGQSFWASRFQKPSELAFIFEAQEHRGSIDWRSLYFGVSKAMYHSNGLQNRKRVWDLIHSPLSELVSMRWSGNSALLSLGAHEDQLRWKWVQGSRLPRETVNLDYEPFEAGYRPIYFQRTSIPNSLRQIDVSIMSIGTETYVTGIRFIPNEGSQVQLGYTTKEEGLSIHTESLFLSMKGLRGFILATGFRGIRALQVVTHNGQLSLWFGNSDGLPKSRRLIQSKPIDGLEAGFDVRNVAYCLSIESLTSIRDSKWSA